MRFYTKTWVNKKDCSPRFWTIINLGVLAWYWLNSVCDLAYPVFNQVDKIFIDVLMGGSLAVGCCMVLITAKLWFYSIKLVFENMVVPTITALVVWEVVKYVLDGCGVFWWSMGAVTYAVLCFVMVTTYGVYTDECFNNSFDKR